MQRDLMELSEKHKEEVSSRFFCVCVVLFSHQCFNVIVVGGGGVGVCVCVCVCVCWAFLLSHHLCQLHRCYSPEQIAFTV